MTTIYLSSTYSDLKVHREAVYHALRQMRYDVIAMEDYVATDKRPLKKCLDDVASSDLYVGLFAWRYGYIPSEENPEQKSITELEYRKAIQTDKPCLIFLLAENVPWSPALIDAVTGEGNRGEYITVLRRELVKERMISFFKTPEHLASLVSPAVHLWENSCAIAEREARLKAMLADHSGFLRDRLESFVGRQIELEEIRQRIVERLKTGGYVTITGQAGQGKSSMIAKLVEEYDVDSTAFHFIPFNPGPDHQVGLLRNIMAHLILKYDLSDLYVASESRTALSEYFPKVLAALAEKSGQEVIFIDGLDQLKEDVDGERDLSFLPNDLPPGIVFILGTRPDDALRPLKLLKPHDEYHLPNLSRQDFDLILQHRGNRLEKNLADEFYQAMQENALYLDLVAKELAEDETAIPAAIVKRIADNPNNLFSLSMARLKRRHSQWRDVIKPVLGSLLVAREPLSLRHLREIIGVDDDSLREGIERLGGLLAQDGQHRYYLFHLKLQDYLRQNERIPEKEYVFATDEEEGWHKKLAQWCEQGNMTIWQVVKYDQSEKKRLEYALQHYVSHLYTAREWQRLFEVLDTEEYGRAKIRYDPGMRFYAQDLDLGRQAATWEGWTLEEGIAFLPRLWRYTLLRCSLTSRADTYSLEEFEILMWLRYEQEALGLAELLTSSEYKSRVFILIGKWLERESRRRQEGLQLFMRAQEVAKSIEESEIATIALGQISGELTQAQEWERAEAVARIIKPSRARSEALWELGRALVHTQQWDRVELIVGIIEERWIKIKILRALCLALAQAHQWERAEAVAYTLENPEDRVDVLRELGVAFAQAQQWKQAETLARSLKQIKDRVIVLQKLAEALTNVQQRMRAAAIWDEVLALVSRIKGNDIRIKVLLELGRTLTHVQQWERAEVVWDEVLSLVYTVEMSKNGMEVTLEIIKTLAQAQQWDRAEEVARSLQDSWDKAIVLRELGIALAQAQQWDRVEEVARSLQDRQDKALVQRELVKALAQAQQWDRAEAIWAVLLSSTHMFDISKNEVETLRELGIALVQMQQWDQAEEVASYLQDSWDKAFVRRELGIALAQAQQWNRAEEVVRSLQIVFDKALVQQELVKALAQAQQWDRVEEVARSLQDSWDKALVRRELGIALAWTQQWDRAEEVARSLQDIQDKAIVLQELGIALAQAQQWNRAEEVVRSLEQIGNEDEVLLALSKELTQVRRWDRAKRMIHRIRNDEVKINALKDFIIQLDKVNQLDENEVLWAESVVVSHSANNSRMKARLLQELASSLSNVNKNEYILHMVQRMWLLVETTEEAIELLSLVTRLIPLNTKISMAFYEAFAWVGDFLKS